MSWQIKEMSAAEYRLVAHKLRLNKAQCARYFQISLTSVQRRWDGKGAIPAAEAMVLRALLHYGEQPEVPPHEGVKARRARERLALVQ